MTQEDENAIRALYINLLQSWNNNDAKHFAANFAVSGTCIGFDGSEYTSAAEIERELGAIFKDHTVAHYVHKIREVRFVTADVAILSAVASMVPPEKHDINPDRNVIHTVVAVKESDRWQITLYQNTPATYDGRPEKSQKLTDELRTAITD